MSWLKKAQNFISQEEIRSIIDASNGNLDEAVSSLENIPNICDYLSSICGEGTVPSIYEEGSIPIFYKTVFQRMCSQPDINQMENQMENQIETENEIPLENVI